MSITDYLDQLDQAREKATPGPWEHNPINGVHTPVGSCVATTHRHDDAERRADAALIVAAVNALPELLAAVRAGLALADELEADSRDALKIGAAARDRGDREVHRISARHARVAHHAASQLRAALTDALGGAA